MAEQVLAAVRTGPSTTELREYPMPEIPADGALLKVEVAGICGTDVKMYAHPVIESPVIMGHENVGTIVKAGRDFVHPQKTGLSGEAAHPWRRNRSWTTSHMVTTAWRPWP